MPDIMILAQVVLQILRSQGCITIQNAKVEKRGIIQPNIYRILCKANQVIYTLDTICMPNIMFLAQGVLQIFCSQCPLWLKSAQYSLFVLTRRKITINQSINQLWLKYLSLKRGIIHVNQVIYIMCPNCMPDIMILAQGVV